MTKLTMLSPYQSVLDLWLICFVLFYLHQGCSTLVSVTENPSIIVSQLDGNVTLNCQFFHTSDEVITGPILYWYYGADVFIYPKISPQYQNRVVVLNLDLNYRNSSIILLRVQWEDSKKYHCMVSYERAGRGARTRGQGVMLQVHGPMTFNISDELERKLQCNIKVSENSNLYLTVFRDGKEVARSQNDPSNHHTGLSALIPFENGREYECQLNLGSTVVLTRSFMLQKPHAQDLPEPVFLYAIILLIPLSVLLVFLVILLIHKICCKGSGSP
ncbi:uncharacterized protein LOC125748556 [Brienomyrus brachyistius]|uniref:uncharacterized protein LOC125748556 n=1 Tax=Brienomyrus brachyistius TaxID=42636 RepID=UPI0020B264D5|nr:uncharacterized protein LOC125727106 isoform X1 [Brienomyrus brachyistius]XP_048880804.1 uncharacterized protein LOC125748556 [Brienomyrus brachyistius]